MTVRAILLSMSTRSSKIAAIKPAAGVATIAYTVPDNTALILKHAVMSNNSATDDVVVLSVTQAGTPTAQLVQNRAVLALSASDWSGWVVLHPGDVVNVRSSNGNVVFWLSGAKLVGVA